VIADTGFLIAHFVESDRHHSWAKGMTGYFDAPFITCEEVVTETAHLLGSSNRVIQMLREGQLKIEFALEDYLEDLDQLARRYADRNPDLADLCLIRMSELFPRLSILTVDRDFRVYRKNRNQIIPVFMPDF